MHEQPVSAGLQQQAEFAYPIYFIFTHTISLSQRRLLLQEKHGTYEQSTALVVGNDAEQQHFVRPVVS